MSHDKGTGAKKNQPTFPPPLPTPPPDPPMGNDLFVVNFTYDTWKRYVINDVRTTTYWDTRPIRYWPKRFVCFVYGTTGGEETTRNERLRAFVYLYDLYSFPYNVTFYTGPSRISTFTSVYVRVGAHARTRIARAYSNFVANFTTSRFPIDSKSRFREEEIRISPISIPNYRTIINPFPRSFPVHDPWSWKASRRYVGIG